MYILGTEHDFSKKKKIFTCTWKNKDYLWKQKEEVNVTVIKQGPENRTNINLYAYDVFYLTRTICRTPKFLYKYMGVYEYG